MSELPSMGCPDEQDLAAFLEGALEPLQRAAVERHVADCPECAAVVAGAAHFVHGDAATDAEPHVRARWPWLAAAAAVLVAVLAPALMRQLADRRDPLVRLRRAAAESTARSVEGRLAHFDFAHFERPRSEVIVAVPMAIRAAAEWTKERGGDDAHSLHARGVAALLVGDTPQAVELLSSAVRADSSNADTWNDLAVAQDASAKPGDRDVYRNALAAADRAVSLAPSSPAAHFTRAVVLDHLGRKQDAAPAYRRALALDPNSSWANETRERLALLR